MADFGVDESMLIEARKVAECDLGLEAALGAEVVRLSELLRTQSARIRADERRALRRAVKRLAIGRDQFGIKVLDLAAVLGVFDRRDARAKKEAGGG